MSLFTRNVDIPLQQKAIHERCFHPSGNFVEFKKEAVEQSIPDRFEEQVRLYPDRLAVKSKDQELTYNQLNKAANRLAHTIIAERGEGPEPVAVLFEHGAQMVAALLGVLKARKFFVPIDASHPTQKISGILKDSQVSLIVTSSPNLSLTREMSRQRCKVVDIDEIDQSVSDRNPGSPIAPDDFAAIIYTSGSTGVPKGVVHSHSSLLHMAMNHTNANHICQGDLVALVHSMSSSAGIRVAFVALLNGAALYPFNVKHDGVAKLAKWLIQEEITILRLPVSVLRQIVSNLRVGENFPKLRVLHPSTSTIRN